MKFLFLTAGVILLLVLVSYPVQAQDRCVDVLERAVDSTAHVGIKNLRIAYQSALRQYRATQQGKNVGANLNIPVPIVDMVAQVGGGYEQSMLNSMSEKYATDNSSSLADDDYIWLMKRTLPPAAIEAWSQCMEGNRPELGGFQIRLDEVTGSNMIIAKIRWQPRFGIATVPLGDLYVSGGRVASNGGLTTGTSITSEWITLLIERYGTDEIIVAVNGNDLKYGSASERSKPKTVQRSCGDDNLSVCRAACEDGDPYACKLVCLLEGDQGSCERLAEWIERNGAALSNSDAVRALTVSRITGYIRTYYIDYAAKVTACAGLSYSKSCDSAMNRLARQRVHIEDALRGIVKPK